MRIFGDAVVIERLLPLFYTSDVFASVTLVVVLLLFRLLFGRALRRREHMTAPAVRRWTANMRNFLLLAGIVGLVMIWAPQLRTFALSLTAVAVAVVVATKELILCLSGSALRTFTRAYSVGDYVEIGGVRGEVLDYNLLVTTLREFDGREGSFVATGREVVVPHSLLFLSPSRIAGEADGRVLHRFVLTFEPEADLFARREAIEEVANAAFAKLESASEGRGKPAGKAMRSAGSPPGVQIGIGTSDIGKYRLEIGVKARAHNVEQAENAIAGAVGSFVHGLRSGEGNSEGHAGSVQQ